MLRGSDTTPTPDIPLSAAAKVGATIIEDVLTTNETTTEESEAQSEGPHADPV